MSRINRVEVQEFAFDLPDLGFDAGGFNIVYQPKNKLKLSKYAIAIETDDGARGEYVALWGGTKMALGQTLALAPHLLGRDPHQRELIYDDFKRALRQYDHKAWAASTSRCGISPASNSMRRSGRCSVVGERACQPMQFLSR